MRLKREQHLSLVRLAWERMLQHNGAGGAWRLLLNARELPHCACCK